MVFLLSTVFCCPCFVAYYSKWEIRDTDNLKVDFVLLCNERNWNTDSCGSRLFENNNNNNYYYYLLRKATISFVMPVCPFIYLSVCPHGTTRLPLDVYF
jgi:hypothetical protein